MMVMIIITRISIHRERKREGFYVSPFELEWKLAKLSWMAGPPIP